MGYQSYLEFFTELKAVIRDCSVEFDTEKYRSLSDTQFDIKYKTLLSRIQARCKAYSDAWFFGPSSYVDCYTADIAATKESPRALRFGKLLEITDAYLRLTVV